MTHLAVPLVATSPRSEIHRLTFVCDNQAMTARLMLAGTLKEALFRELNGLVNQWAADLLPVHPMFLTVDEPSHSGTGKVVDLLQDVADSVLDIDITAPTSQPTSLHAFLEEAQAFDAVRSATSSVKSLVTWKLSFVRDLGGADDRYHELTIVAHEASNDACRSWLNELTSWLEDEGYAYAVSHWNRASETEPHVSIQGALDDLADQMRRAGLAGHPWVKVLRQDVAVAHAQTRVNKSPPLAPPAPSDRRTRSRP